MDHGYVIDFSLEVSFMFFSSTLRSSIHLYNFCMAAYERMIASVLGAIVEWTSRARLTTSVD